MKIAVLGTGVVGRTLAGKLAELGHQVTIGTRDVDATLAKTEPDGMGTPPYRAWAAEHDGVALATFAGATAGSELIINATSGSAAVAALTDAGAANLTGKIIVDVSNPLDFSAGWPPKMSVPDTDSVGERIQRAFPDAKVVKSLNTLSAPLMVAPQELAGGDHSVFVSGDDPGAKNAVTSLLESLGHTDVIDTGDITTARGVEFLMPFWVRMYSTLGTGHFNYKIVR